MVDLYGVDNVSENYPPQQFNNGSYFMLGLQNVHINSKISIFINGLFFPFLKQEHRYKFNNFVFFHAQLQKWIV